MAEQVFVKWIRQGKGHPVGMGGGEGGDSLSKGQGAGSSVAPPPSSANQRIDFYKSSRNSQEKLRLVQEKSPHRGGPSFLHG